MTVLTRQEAFSASYALRLTRILNDLLTKNVLIGFLTFSEQEFNL